MVKTKEDVMLFGRDEILETVRMLEMEHLDIRTVTMGINLMDCADEDVKRMAEKIYTKLLKSAKNLVSTARQIELEYGIKIVNKRLSITPISQVAEAAKEKDFVLLAKTIDKAAKTLEVDFLGGFSALVEKGFTPTSWHMIHSLPDVLAITDRVCSSVNIGTSDVGINMVAVDQMGQIICKTAQQTADRGGIGCAKLVVFANAVPNNPFMAGAFHGQGQPDLVINVGVSGPGVVKTAVERLGDADLGTLAETIKRTAFKITRLGELVGRTVAHRLGLPFGIVDLSLAPTPAIGDSVSDILEAMGLERTGAHGTTAALAMLTDAVKKGGTMASSYVGGLSGAFIPVSEDAGMISAVQVGSLSLEKLEAMTAVCSVGLDMVAVPGDTSPEIIAGIIADEAAIGVINRKTTAVRIIPAPNKKEGDLVDFGGLLGTAPIMPVNRFCPKKFIKRGGEIPAPINSLRN